jgi:hypothetical protein
MKQKVKQSLWKKKILAYKPKKVLPRRWNRNNKITIGKINETKEEMERPQQKCIILVFYLFDW